MESLIKAGAMDCFLPDKSPRYARAILLSRLDEVVDTAHLIAKEKESSAASLFGDDFSSMMSFKKKTDTSLVRPLSQNELLGYEKEVMGLYFTGHPIARYQKHLTQLNCSAIIDVLDGKVSGRLNIIGIVTRLKKRQNKKKEEWAQFVAEDCTGSIMINAFSKTWAQIGHKITPNAILFFSGDVRIDDESARVEMNLKDIENVTELIANVAKTFTIHLTPNYPPSQLQKLKMLLDTAKGVTMVYLEVPSKENPSKIHRIRTNKSIMLHHALLEHLENTLGEQAWSFT